MKHSFPGRLARLPAAITGRLSDLVREMAPIVLFFFVAFMLIFLMFKLFVAQYAIEFSAFGKAAAGALILGKVIALLDWAGSGRRFEGYRKAAVILFKTLLYGVVVIIIGIGEKIFHSVREAGSLSIGLIRVIANANVDRFFGLVLLVCVTVASYLVIQEISRAMGKGALFRLFFQLPTGQTEPQPPAA